MMHRLNIEHRTSNVERRMEKEEVEMEKAQVLKAQDAQVIESDWGELTWFANRELGNSDDVTVGRCVIYPGKSNPAHSHPNCSEILVVEQGTIRHALGDGTFVEMGPGDTISVPVDCPHHAENVGDTNAVLSIVFTNAVRKTDPVS